RLVYYAFDCLEAGGEPLVASTLEERRERLVELVRPGAVVLLSEAFDDGRALLEAVTEQELEGIIAKRRGAPYTRGARTRDWLKPRARAGQEFVIAGYTRGSGSRASTFGSLVLAVNDGGELLYAGNVGTGFDDREIQKLLAKLRPLERPEPPFASV